MSASFNLSLAREQGYSLSPLLFKIVFETLAIAIRANANIKGVERVGKEQTLLLYMDNIN